MHCMFSVLAAALLIASASIITRPINHRGIHELDTRCGPHRDPSYRWCEACSVNVKVIAQTTDRRSRARVEANDVRLFHAKAQ
jgi:hypothetical protein